ncbi:MAG: apolipoprotein N-acyltransferase [Chitinophagales bacterium]|nr:apolipoprotein N-acyltransferase [Chitinophagales bacterium]
MWLSWPADGIVWLKFVALAPLLGLPEIYPQISGMRFFLWSYWAFFLWNLLCTWWVWNASPEGAVVAIVFNSLFMACVFRLGLFVRRQLGVARGALGMVSLWLAFEFLHQRWDLSWPWLTLGFGFANMPEWIQWYQWTGPLGGSAWILVCNYAVARLLRSTDVMVILKRLATALSVIGIPVIFSYFLYFREDHSERVPLRVTLLQPNIDPWHEKFEALSPQAQVRKLLAMAEASPADLYVAPETSIPSILWEHELMKDSLFSAFRRFVLLNPHSAFITGLSTQRLIREEEGPALSAEPVGPGLYMDDYNTAAFITSDTVILYHKSKLVPGPEMLPFPQVLKPLQQKLFGRLGGMIGNLGIQEEPTVFPLPEKRMHVAPAICYESVFPDFMARFVRRGARLIAVITNDGWWGDTPGYRQHFAYARILAVSLGIPVVQAANTGISGIISAKGDVERQTNFWEPVVVGQTLLVPIRQSPTLFARVGDWPGRLGILVGTLLLLLAIRQRILRHKIF